MKPNILLGGESITATRPSGFNMRKMLTLISARMREMVANVTHEHRIAMLGSGKQSSLP
jgi:hypothetical protein